MERRTHISPENKSPEVVLERAIAVLAERGDLAGWYNQIPVASGLIDDRADKRAAVDLVRVNQQHADLIELKWGSDTPAFAAFEILRYGLAYIFCRDRKDEFGYGEKPLLEARSVGLMVLAPAVYYESHNLGFIARLISEGLGRVCERRDDGLTMTFSFQAFPQDFKLPFSNGTEVKALKNGAIYERQCSRLVDALSRTTEVWP